MSREVMFSDTSPYPITAAGIELEHIPSLNFDDYQTATNDLASYHGGDEPAAEYLAYGLWGEAVELGSSKYEYALSLIRSAGPDDMPADIRMGMMFELGDTRWYLTQLAEIHGAKLSEIAHNQCAQRLLMNESPSELTLDTYQSLVPLMPDIGTLTNKWGLEVTADLNAGYVLNRRAAEMVYVATDTRPVQTSNAASAVAKATIEDAIGNALWITSYIAHRLGLPDSQIAAYNLAKLYDRRARDVTDGAGDYR